MDNRAVSRGDNAQGNSAKELSKQHSYDRLMQLRDHHGFQDANVPSKMDTSASADASTRSRQRSDRHVQDSSLQHAQGHQGQLDLSDPRVSGSKGDAIASEATTSCHGSDGGHHDYLALVDLFDQWHTKSVLNKKRLDRSDSGNIHNPLLVPDFPDIMINPLFELYSTNKQPEMDVSISPSGIGMDKNPHVHDVPPVPSGEASSLTIPKIKLAEGHKANRVRFTLSEKKYELANPEIVSNMNDKALDYKQQGKYQKAKQLYQKVLTIHEQLGPERRDTAVTLHNLAEVCYKLDEYEEAKQLFNCGLAIVEKVCNPGDSLLKEFRKNQPVYNNACKLNSAERSGKHLPLMSLDGQGTSKAQSEITYDAEQHINIKKQIYDTVKSNDGKQYNKLTQIKSYFTKNPFTMDDFSDSLDEIGKLTKYNRDIKHEFLHDYYKNFGSISPLTSGHITKFNILRSWQNDGAQVLSQKLGAEKTDHLTESRKEAPSLPDDQRPQVTLPPKTELMLVQLRDDFAEIALRKLYARCKPPWDNGN